jgi:A/G-specific adenine glycosylase
MATPATNRSQEASALPPDIAKKLLSWFSRHARDLPWRRARTPYRVWVAEVMLQQTRAEVAAPFYQRFLHRFPAVEALAAASLDEVLKAWEGLGYYARARHLHAAARLVLTRHGGRLPPTVEELLELPGIGEYTAGAVASIAFGQPVIALDGNARRVITRLFAVDGDPRRAATRRRLETLATTLLPLEEPGQFNEALMELGATICRPRLPRCGDCPLPGLCCAHREGREEQLPERSPRQPIPHHHVAAAVTVREDRRVLVARRMPDDFLGGLWEFPGGRLERDESPEDCLVREMLEELGIEVEVGERLLSLKHAYSHFRITLHAFRCRLRSGEPHCLECADFRWASAEELATLPMSAADRRIARLVQTCSMSEEGE